MDKSAAAMLNNTHFMSSENTTEPQSDVQCIKAKQTVCLRKVMILVRMMNRLIQRACVNDTHTGSILL